MQLTAVTVLLGRSLVFCDENFQLVILDVEVFKTACLKLWPRFLVVGSPWKSFTGTIDNLRKRGVLILDRHCMCKESDELVDYLLLHCVVATKLWMAVFSRLELAWVMSASVLAVLASWPNLGGFRYIAAVQRMILTCIFWCLWQERNTRTYEDKMFLERL